MFGIGNDVVLALLMLILNRFHTLLCCYCLSFEQVNASLINTFILYLEKHFLKYPQNSKAK